MQYIFLIFVVLCQFAFATSSKLHRLPQQVEDDLPNDLPDAPPAHWLLQPERENDPEKKDGRFEEQFRELEKQLEEIKKKLEEADEGTAKPGEEQKRYLRNMKLSKETREFIRRVLGLPISNDGK